MYKISWFFITAQDLRIQSHYLCWLFFKLARARNTNKTKKNRLLLKYKVFRYSLSQSNIAIASLVVAFYPIYPHSITDNRLYFQTLRFLWPLAVESRFFATIDARTGENISVDVDVRLVDDAVKLATMKTPCILPHLDKIAAIQLKNADYGPVNLVLSNRMDSRKLHEVVKNFYGRMPIHRATK